MQLHWWNDVVSDRSMPSLGCRSTESAKGGTIGALSRPGSNDIWSLIKSQERFHFADGQRVLQSQRLEAVASQKVRQSPQLGIVFIAQADAVNGHVVKLQAGPDG